LRAQLIGDAAGDQVQYLLSLERLDQERKRVSQVLCVQRAWIQASEALALDPHAARDGVHDALALGSHLGAQIFELFEQELLPLLQSPLELWVELPEQLAWLPWEALGTKREIGQTAPAFHPVLEGHWSLIRELSFERELGASLARAPRRTHGRRVLLVIGDVDQELANPWQDIGALIDFLRQRELGFELRIAAGRPEIIRPGREDLRVEHVLKNFEDLAQAVTVFAPDLLHFVGHSIAERKLQAGGRRRLWLELAYGTGEPRRVPFDPDEPAALPVLSAAAGVDCTAVIFHNCIAREALARAFLAAGAARLAIGSSALLAPTQSASSAAAFYGRLAERTCANLLDALERERRMLWTSESYRGTAWIPALWCRDANAPLPRPVSADELESERVLDEYCRQLSSRQKTLRGELEKKFGLALVPSYVPVEVCAGRGAQREGLPLDDVDGVVAERGSESGERGRFEELLENALSKSDRVLLFTLGGGPGTGKTTTLRVYARNEAERPRRKRIPIYLELARWLGGESGALDLGAFVEREFQLPGLRAALERRAAKGEVFVALDGYDELDIAQRERFLAATPWTRAPWDHTPIVLGTRRYLSAQRFVGAAWQHFDMCPLSPALATQLLRQLLETNAHTKAHLADHLRLWPALWSESGPRFWRELARVPLFVALIALLAAKRKDPRTIRDRASFLDEVLSALWSEPHHDPRSAPRIAEEPAMPEAARALLREIALELCFRKTRDLAVEEIDRRGWRASLDAIAERSLVFAPLTTAEDAPWRFWHRSFQEALAAEELWRRFVVPHEGNPEAASEALVAFLEGRVPALKDGATWTPDAERVAQVERELREQWAADEGAASEMRRDVLQQDLEARLEPGSSGAELLFEHYRRRNPAQEQNDNTTRWHVRRKERGEVIPRLLAPFHVRDEEQEYLIEPLALLAERKLSIRGLGAALLRRFASNDWPLVCDAFDRLESLECATLLAGFERAPSPWAQIDVLERWSDAVAPSERAQAAQALEALGLAPGFSTDLDLRAALVDAVRRLEVEKAVPEALPGPRESALLRVFYPIPSNTARELLRQELSDFFEDGQGRRARRWCLLEAGRYLIGSPVDCEHHYPNERPFEAKLTQPLWLAAAAVTCRLFALFQPQHKTWWRDRSTDTILSLPDRVPVMFVNYLQARAFCRWLALHGAEELKHHVGRAVVPRLPTEVEREAATRAGADPRWRYWSGDDESDLARVGWYRKNIVHHLPESGRELVALLEPNPLGLYDVHGNLWEWCLDWSATYPEGSAIDYRGPSHGRARVLRGGSFWIDAVNCRSAFRNAELPCVSHGDIGFRVALAPAPELGRP
jgi:formylglycine-generating enzyme required for sulfatase activity